MKTYEPRRNNECPNGLHADYDPAKDPTQNECTCPWLIIQSTTPVPHLTSWNRRETENVIREMDRGFFDPPGYPKRTGSMFLSPAMQRLLDVAEKEPVAAALTLLAGSGSGLPPFDAIAWDAEDAVLSLRSGAAGGWRRLWLGHANVETVTDQSKTPGGVAPVLLWAEHPDTATETGLPEGLVATPHEPAQDYFAEDITGTAPLVFEVPADQLGEMRAGNPMFDELMQRATDENAGGLVFIPAELASSGAISQGVALVGEDGRVSGFDAVREGMATLPRLEDVPLPLRVPQVPSNIAEAGQGDYCTCDLNLRYTCPLCRDALDQVRQVEGALSRTAEAGVIGDESSCPDCGQFLTAAEILGDMTTHDCALPDRTCVCDIRGSSPDTYNCPEHGSDTM